MRALLTSPPGGWANTEVSDISLREGRPDEVLVKIQAVGLNPADNFQIEGMYPGGPKPPFIPGRDAAGIVVRAGTTSGWTAGDPVVVLQTSTTNLADGTLCDEQWVADENLASLPNGWSPQEAAATPLVYLTAWKALVDVGGLQSGQHVVITGASGGVGLACVQLAAALGAQVVALSRSSAKRDTLIKAGAKHVFSPETPNLKEAIYDAIQSKGVHLVVDNVGGPSLTSAVHLVGIHGRVSVVGVLAGVEAAIPIPALMFKRASIHGVLVTDDTPAKAQASWKAIVELMNRAKIRPLIDSQFSLSDAAGAFEKLRTSVVGKVIVNVG